MKELIAKSEKIKTSWELFKKTDDSKMVNQKALEQAVNHIDALTEALNDEIVNNRYEKKFIYKQVERGLFDKHTTADLALNNIAYWLDAPWSNKEWSWDVSHKEYANEFYKKFPIIECENENE